MNANVIRIEIDKYEIIKSHFLETKKNSMIFE
jgi:hypothetical protein